MLIGIGMLLATANTYGGFLRPLPFNFIVRDCFAYGLTLKFPKPVGFILLKTSVYGRVCHAVKRLSICFSSCNLTVL